MKGRRGKFGMLGVERGKGVIMETTGARHMARRRSGGEGI
jgi:hypothetical protein